MQPVPMRNRPDSSLPNCLLIEIPPGIYYMYYITPGWILDNAHNSQPRTFTSSALLYSRSISLYS